MEKTKKRGKIVSKLSKDKVASQSAMFHKVVTKIVVDDERFIPKYSTEGSACVDLVANLPEGPIRLPHRGIVRVDCGFSMELPSGWKAEIAPRSSLSLRGLTIPNSPAQIDSDFRGRIEVILMNSGKEIIVVEDGDRFAQMWVSPVYIFDFQTVDTLTETNRASGGFGSTGMR